MNAPSPFRRLCAFTTLVVILQMLVLQAMAASGELHHHFHNHAEEPEHQCAVTLMISGGYDSELPDIVPVHVTTEPPDVPVWLLSAVNFAPSHLVGGVMAHAAPRGP
jgi:hypothetical protein